MKKSELRDMIKEELHEGASASDKKQLIKDVKALLAIKNNIVGSLHMFTSHEYASEIEDDLYVPSKKLANLLKKLK